MIFKSLTMSAIAATMLIGSAASGFAQQSSAPMPTGSAGNSNTGPTAQPGGHTGVMGGSGTSVPSQAGASAAPMNNTTAPMPTGSAGNSNTGPGAMPPK